MSGVGSFKPSEEVLQAHKLPHLNENLQLVSGDFTTIAIDAQGYLFSVVRFPIFIVACAWFCVFAYYASLIVRCCFKFTKRFMRCLKRCCARGTVDDIPEHIHDSADEEAEQEGRLTLIGRAKRHVGDHSKCRSCLMYFNFALMVVLCVTTACVFKGDQNLSDSFDSVKTSLRLIIKIFQDISSIAMSGLQLGQSVVTSSVQTCDMNNQLTDSQQAEVEKQALTIEMAMSSLNSMSEPVGHFLNKGIDYFGYLKGRKTAVLLGFFASILTVCVIFQVGTWKKSSCTLRVGSFLSALMILVVSVLAGVSMSFSVFMGDLCIDPSGNLVGLFAPGSVMRQNLEYFLYCQGQNPFQTQVDIATTALNSLNSTLQNSTYSMALSQECKDILQSDIAQLSNILYEIPSLVSCVPIFQLYDTAVQMALCNQGTAGFYNIMVVLFAAAAELYLLMSTVSIFYHWYMSVKVEVNYQSSPRLRRKEDDNELGGSHSVTPPIWARETNDIVSPIQGQRRIFGGGVATPQASPSNPFDEQTTIAARTGTAEDKGGKATTVQFEL